MNTSQFIPLLKGSLCALLLFATSNVRAEYYISDSIIDECGGGTCFVETPRYHSCAKRISCHHRRVHHRIKPSGVKISVYVVNPCACAERVRTCNSCSSAYVAPISREEVFYDETPRVIENVGSSFGDSYVINRGGMESILY